MRGRRAGGCGLPVDPRAPASSQPGAPRGSAPPIPPGSQLPLGGARGPGTGGPGVPGLCRSLQAEQVRKGVGGRRSKARPWPLRLGESLGGALLFIFQFNYMHECFERVFCELKWRKEVTLKS